MCSNCSVDLPPFCWLGGLNEFTNCADVRNSVALYCS